MSLFPILTVLFVWLYISVAIQDLRWNWRRGVAVYIGDSNGPTTNIVLRYAGRKGIYIVRGGFKTQLSDDQTAELQVSGSVWFQVVVIV